MKTASDFAPVQGGTSLLSKIPGRQCDKNCIRKIIEEAKTLSEVTMQKGFIATVILSGAVAAFSGFVQAENAPVMGKKGTSPYVTHFIFRPVQSLEIPGVGTAHLLEAVGTTQNLKGEPMMDKMAARCTALNVESGEKKYIDGACALTDKDGDVIFSTFDTRDVDPSQPDMKCGTHIITGGSGKYNGITGREPFACQDMPKLAGAGGYFAMDIPHNTTWEIKSKSTASTRKRSPEADRE